MDKDKILDYVMNSPANTNPNVLGSMLEGMGGGDDSFVNKVFFINGTAEFKSYQGGGHWDVTTDKTYDEVVGAINMGKVPLCMMDVNPNGNPPWREILLMASYSEAYEYVNFYRSDGKGYFLNMHPSGTYYTEVN